MTWDVTKLPQEKPSIRVSLPLVGRFVPRPRFEEEYERNELLKHDNANIPPSASAMYVYNTLKLLEQEFDQFMMCYCPEALRAHKDLLIYIHKVPEILYVKYCQGIEARIITRRGLIANVTSGPPRHLTTAVEQIKRAVIYANFESAGAIGINEICLVLAPYVRHDPDVRDFKHVHNAVQSFLYELNATERPSAQSPFTNTGFGVEYGEDTLREYKVYYAGRDVGTASEYLDEALMVFSALVVEYLSGDFEGKPHTFPIPSIVYTQHLRDRLSEFDVELPLSVVEKFQKLLGCDLPRRCSLWELFWTMVALRGYPYFMHREYEKTARSFCCRLTIDFRKVWWEAVHQTRGIWTIPPIFGSIDYVSIDVFRIVWESRDDDEILERLLYAMEIARRALNVIRANLERLYDEGKFRITKWLVEAFGLVGHNPLREFYYNTIAFPNLAEACNLYIIKFCNDKILDLPIGHVQGLRTIWATIPEASIKREVIRFYRMVLEFANEVVREFEKEDERPYNIEQSPAETLNAKLAERNLRLFGKDVEPYIPREVDPVSGKVQYFFTSQLTPPYCLWSLEDQIDIEAEIQPLFTGGVIKLLFIFKPFWSPEWSREEKIDGLARLEKLVDWIMERGVRYLGVTPTQCYCLDCGYVWVGDRVHECPRCGSENIEVWSRIVGYYRPVIRKRNGVVDSTWNPAKRAEFVARLRYATKWV